jgi:hypothetical protein
LSEHGFAAYPEVEMKPEAKEWVTAEASDKELLDREGKD